MKKMTGSLAVALWANKPGYLPAPFCAWLLACAASLPDFSSRTWHFSLSDSDSSNILAATS